MLHIMLELFIDAPDVMVQLVAFQKIGCRIANDADGGKSHVQYRLHSLVQLSHNKPARTGCRIQAMQQQHVLFVGTQHRQGLAPSKRPGQGIVLYQDFNFPLKKFLLALRRTIGKMQVGVLFTHQINGQRLHPQQRADLQSDFPQYGVIGVQLVQIGSKISQTGRQFHRVGGGVFLCRKVGYTLFKSLNTLFSVHFRTPVPETNGKYRRSSV